MKYENIDLIDALRRISDIHTEHYKEDFELDQKLIRDLAATHSAEDKHLLWMSRPHGTHIMREREVYIEDTYENKTWEFYRDQTSDPILAYSVEITGVKDGTVVGNLIELDYTAHVDRMKQLIEGLRHIVIGGAYSVDKFYRLSRGYGWWADEQPSEEIKRYVEQQLKDNSIDVVLSHTCPFKYEPIEEFIPGIDQSTVDNSTEKWLDKIEERTDYIAWFCGHWHTNKRIDDMHFLFHKFESSKAIKEIAMAKRLTNNEIGVAIGNYNILTTFATRYALGQPTLAPTTMERIIEDSLDVLHEQTKHGIIRDIEDYIDQHENIDDLATWQRIMEMLKNDLGRKKKDG